ncbi:hypothetical protein [Streptomyces sp. NPDC048361]
MPDRRPAREYDHRLGTSASPVQWDSAAGMTRRLTTSAHSRRDTFRTTA